MEAITSSPAPGRRGAHMAKYRTCKNAFDFATDLEKAAQVLGMESAQDAAVALALTLVGKITAGTPRHTGRAQANWFIAEGAPRIEVTDSTTPQNHTAVPLTGKGVIYITNSLPYIVPLEHGHSKQAPFGMVRKAIAEMHAILNVAGGAA